MNTPLEAYNHAKKNIKKEWKTAFYMVMVIGFLTHLPVMTGDFPNHDGLASMYFDQNMITSGRWFLTIACGISSYFTIPWVIGIFSLVFLGIGAAALVDFLGIRQPIGIFVISGLLVTFPSLCSTYAYIFTADGYMMALALVFLALALTKHYQKGFIAGGICLAFSMGTYQSYLAFAILLSIYGCIMIMLSGQTVKEKLFLMLHYLYMGIIGVGLYYLILQVLLKIQGKVLDTYQGINGMAAGDKADIAQMLKGALADFLAFTGKGNILYNNVFSFAALLVIFAVFMGLFVRLCIQRKLYTKWFFYLILPAIVVVLPVATNVILLISPDVTYHLLMRYQWVLYPMLLIVFMLRYGFGQTELTGQQRTGKIVVWAQWLVAVSAVVLIINYAVTDNIAYSNLSKKYEKTYAYCLRLADRMEQTEGYYTGMPVAMIGVQSAKNLPQTDITGDVTSNMIGMTGDYLVYTDTNYQSFMSNYLGITMNLVSDQEMEEIYQTQEYQALSSFPAEGSMKVVDGILYIKTE